MNATAKQAHILKRMKRRAERGRGREAGEGRAGGRVGKSGRKKIKKRGQGQRMDCVKGSGRITQFVKRGLRREEEWGSNRIPVGGIQD